MNEQKMKVYYNKAQTKATEIQLGNIATREREHSQKHTSWKETCLFIHKEGNQGNGKQEGDGTQLDIIREQRGSKTKHKKQSMKKTYKIKQEM